MCKKIWIYKITNVITKKYYVGQTINLYNRLKSHKACRDKDTIIVKSIMKYGWENHAVEVLFFGENITRADADKIEIKFIKEHNSFCRNNKLGMNLTEGSFRGSVNKKSYKKITKNKYDKWVEKLCKKGKSLVVLNMDGEILFKGEPSDVSGLFYYLEEKSSSTRMSIKKALEYKKWTCFKMKYLIGFEDDNPYERYLKYKVDLADRAKKLPKTEKSINVLKSYHRHIHDIPVLDLNTGIYFNTVSEFSIHENRNQTTISERFKKGKYSSRYLLCRN